MIRLSKMFPAGFAPTANVLYATCESRASDPANKQNIKRKRPVNKKDYDRFRNLLSTLNIAHETSVTDALSRASYVLNFAANIQKGDYADEAINRGFFF